MVVTGKRAATTFVSSLAVLGEGADGRMAEEADGRNEEAAEKKDIPMAGVGVVGRERGSQRCSSM
jgi:hypothetical protein